MATQLLMIDGIKVELPDYAAAVVERKVQSLSDTIQELKARDKKRDEEDKKRDDEDDEREEDNAKKDAAIKARDAALKQKDEQLKAKDAQIATLGKQLDENKLTPEKINRAVTDRIGVITKAKQLMGDSLNCDEKTDGDIRRTVVLAKVGESAKGWTDPQVEAAFAVIDPPRNDSFAPVKASEPRRSSLDSMVMAFSTPGGTVGRPGDGYGNLNGPSARDGAYMEYDAHLRDAWKGAKAS